MQICRRTVEADSQNFYWLSVLPICLYVCVCTRVRMCVPHIRTYSFVDARSLGRPWGCVRLAMSASDSAAAAVRDQPRARSGIMIL